MIENELKVIEFELGKLCFGIDIFQIENVINVPEITPLPQAPVFLEGVLTLRESLIPVVNLSKKFKLSKAEASKRSKIIIVSLEERRIGIIVDRVKDVLLVEGDILEEPSLTHQLGIDLEYIKYIAKMPDRLIILLNLEKVFSIEEKKIIQSV